MTIEIEITIPVLNEEASLDRQVRKASTYIREQFTDLGAIRLIIADNGSNDRTQTIAEKLAAEMPDVSYLRLKERGVGRALKASWGSSSADIIGYVDLDLVTDLSHLPEALAPLVRNDADVVTGSRLAQGSRVIGRSLLRSFISRVFNLMLRLYFGVRFTDGMCGFKFLKRDKLDGLMKAGAQNDGWFFATELLICAESRGLRVKDLPVTWTDDPQSKVRIGKLALEYTRSMWVLKRRLRAGGYRC